MLSGQRIDGRAVLHRALRPSEEQALRERMKALEVYVGRGDRRVKRDAISAMLVGFGGPAVSPDEAKEIVSQYGQVVDDLPAWAVARACARFSSGSVKPEEIGEKQSIALGFRPSTAQLYVVAKALAVPVLEERYRIGAAVTGAVAEKPVEKTPESKARVGAWLASYRGEVVAAAADRERAEAERRAAAEARQVEEIARWTDKKIIEEYRARGLEPPELKPGERPTSLSVLVAMGWKVQDITVIGGEGSILVPPPPSAEPKEGLCVL